MISKLQSCSYQSKVFASQLLGINLVYVKSCCRKNKCGVVYSMKCLLVYVTNELIVLGFLLV